MGRVEARYIVGTRNSPDPDGPPILVPARGTVVFTASIPFNPHAVGTPEAFMLVKEPLVGVIDDEGFLCEPDPADPAMPGARGMPLPATINPAAAAAGWQWVATAKLVDAAGYPKTGLIPTVRFTLAAGQTRNLSDLTKAPATPVVWRDETLLLVSAAERAAVRAAEMAEVALDLKRRADAGEFNGPGVEPEPGPAGKSAYQLAVEAGFAGTLAEWLDSLRGEDGRSSMEPGPAGRSAYQLAVEAGFSGTLTEWLDSLKGPKGPEGPVAGAKVTVSATEPDAPAVGDIWFDIS